MDTKCDEQTNKEVICMCELAFPGDTHRNCILQKHCTILACTTTELPNSYQHQCGTDIRSEQEVSQCGICQKLNQSLQGCSTQTNEGMKGKLILKLIHNQNHRNIINLETQKGSIYSNVYTAVQTNCFKAKYNVFFSTELVTQYVSLQSFIKLSLENLLHVQVCFWNFSLSTFY